jgi:hypothetical protein
LFVFVIVVSRWLVVMASAMCVFSLFPRFSWQRTLVTSSFLITKLGEVGSSAFACFMFQGKLQKVMSIEKRGALLAQ